MKFLTIGLSALLQVVAISSAAPPLHTFPDIKADAAGRILMDSMIWTGAAGEPAGVSVVFRKSFELSTKPEKANLALFADARYILWVNGTYVDRGPSRFQPNGPQYDVLDLSAHLKLGKNAIALLVVGNLSGGKVMRHVPGLTALLHVDGKETLRTDSTWQWSRNTRFREAVATWPDLGEKLVDARVEDGDWTQADYPAQGWNPAVAISSASWGPLTRSLIPPLRETAVKFQFAGEVKLPVTLGAGEKLDFETGRIVQAYPVIEMDAEVGTELEIAPFKMKYIARAGQQKHFTIDTTGLSHGSVIVKSGRATITGFKLIERVYAFDRIGSFKSSDAFLNRLWEMCARSCEVLSEDAYVDCADRERVEWMDCTPPAFDVTRTAMAGPGKNGKPVFSDPRLLGVMVRRTGLTLQPEGWVKAHTCSDRYDIHAKMEDRTCEWITGMRIYHESCGDAAVIREVWPAVVAQMEFFLKARTSRGLVRARDWVVWGNPTGYVIGEGTTLNVFVHRALRDASFLASIVGDASNEKRFGSAAVELGKAINTVLWDESTGAYHSGYFSDEDVKDTEKSGRKLKLPRNAGLTPTTLHANVFALDRGVVPADRRERVITKILQQQQGKLGGSVMIYYYLMKQLYDLDQAPHDLRVLEMMREGWKAMEASPLDCSWEGIDVGGGSKAHIYGMYPSYFLSSYVLGVRWQDGVPLNRKLLIQPHLGDLTEAEGTVVTEAGPVFVSWKRAADGSLGFKLNLPPGKDATLALSEGPAKLIEVDGKTVPARKAGSRLIVTLPPGEHSGSSR